MLLFYQEVDRKISFFFAQINIVTFSMLIVFCLLTFLMYKLIDILPYTTKVMIIWKNNETKINIVSKNIFIVMDIILELFCKALWHLLLIPLFVDFLTTIPLINSNIHANTWATITMIASTFALVLSKSQLTSRIKYLTEELWREIEIILNRKREKKKMIRRKQTFATSTTI